MTWRKHRGAKLSQHGMQHSSVKGVNMERYNPTLRPILDRCNLDKQFVDTLESILFQPRGQAANCCMHVCADGELGRAGGNACFFVRLFL